MNCLLENYLLKENMIRRLAKSDYEVASRLLARINAYAKGAFLQAIESGSIDLAFMNDSIAELGVVISARQADKSIIYVSFETDPVSHQRMVINY